MMFDGKAFGEEIVGIMQDYVERQVAPLKAENAELKERLKALEDRPLPELALPEIQLPELPELPDFGPMIEDAVGKAIAALPAPRDGKDAAGIVEALKDSGELVLTLQDGRLIRTGIRDGEKGKDGLNGFSLEDFDVDKGNDGRTYVLKFDGGDIRHEYELTFPVPVYCGVYKEGEQYVPGDMATFGGSLWHCDKETTNKPGTEGWTLAVKKGRDGKDAR